MLLKLMTMEVENMKNLGMTIQSGDWKGEKHVPVIHANDKVAKGEVVEVRVSIGDEIAHPNTHEHHIAWVKLYYHEDGAKFPVEIGTYEFRAHGESGLFAEPFASVKVKVEKSGHFHALSYCNIHGLWENTKELTVQ